MQSAKPRLSELPGFIPCKLGEHLTDEQHKLVFSGGDRFWPLVMKAALAADVALPERETTTRQTSATVGAVA